MNILQAKKYCHLIRLEEAKFTHSALGKTFEIQIKTNEKQEVLKPNTQKLTIKDAIPENTLTEEAKKELNKIKKI